MDLADQIIKQLYFFECLSVSELSALTGKSIPKVTEEVGKLVLGETLMESGFAASTGGRRAMKYAVNAGRLPHIATIAVDQRFTTLAVLDYKNRYVVFPRTIRTDIYGSKDTLDLVIAGVKKMLNELSGEEPLIIGLTMPGFVDKELGVNLSFPVNSPWYDVRKRIQDALGHTVQIANDSSAIAIAEHKLGAAKGSEDVLVVNLNWGVGLGIIIHDKLYKGHAGYAGEFSHIPLADARQLCSCGKKGCLEVEASLSSALSYVYEYLDQGEPSSLGAVLENKGALNLADLVDAFESGDQVVIKAVRKISHMLGKGLSTLIHIMNPEKIIISGNGAAFGSGLLPTIHSAIQEYCIPRLGKLTDVQVSDFADVQTISTACIAVQQSNMYQFQHKQIKLQQL